MREGNAWGLTIISGRIPSSVNGISSSGIIKPTVPFCPHLEQNLSPMAGDRLSRIRILAKRKPSSPSVIKALSTKPCCPFLAKTDESIRISGFSGLVIALPITTVLSSMNVFSFIRPYLSNAE